MVHVAFVRSPACACAHRGDRHGGGEEGAGRDRASSPARSWPRSCTPWVGVLDAPQGHQVGAAARDRRRARLLAGRGGRAPWWRDTRAEAEDACELVEVDYEELPAVTDAETALDAGTPVIHPELGDNLCFERVHRRRRVDEALRRRRRGRRGDLRVRPPHRRHATSRAPSSPTGTRATQRAHRLSRHAGAAHDAEPVRQAPRRSRSTRCASSAKDVGGSFGIKVHIYADEMATVALVEAARAAGQVRRRPARELRHRHPCPRPPRARRRSASRSDGTITAFEIDDLTGIGPYSVYPRTSRHRGQPGRQPDRRALHLPELPRARPRGVPEQERRCASTAPSAIRSRPR